MVDLKAIALSLSLSLSITFSGCAHYQLSKDYKGPVEKPLFVEQFFKKDKILDKKVLLEDQTDDYFKYEGVLYLNSGAEVPFWFFDTKKDFYGERTPAVLVSPILGGDYSDSYLLADFLAKEGISTLVALRNYDIVNPENNPKDLEKILEYTVSEARSLIDWLETVPSVDKEKIGSIGVSLGGIKNSMICAFDSRLKYNVFIMAGGDIADILMNSKESLVKKYRKEKLKNQTKKELLEELDKELLLDPLSVAKFVDSKNVLMFVTKFDECVPTKNQLELRKALGNPETIVVPTGHYGFVITLPYSLYKIHNFFEKSFSSSEQSSSIRKR